MTRWQITKELRKYKCSGCLCLMGMRTQCLNPRCVAYGGKLQRETPTLNYGLPK